jgi:hypothetical protein
MRRGSRGPSSAVENVTTGIPHNKDIWVGSPTKSEKVLADLNPFIRSLFFGPIEGNGRPFATESGHCGKGHQNDQMETCQFFSDVVGLL